MTTELFFLLLRNTLLSWVINVEFAAPLLFWIVAWRNRNQHPLLAKFMKKPFILLAAAGLLKQIYEQGILPGMMVTGDFTIDRLTFWLYQVGYACLLAGGFGLLLKAVYAYRRKPNWKNPFHTVKH